jgi:hypothetical protein
LRARLATSRICVKIRYISEGSIVIGRKHHILWYSLHTHMIAESCRPDERILESILITTGNNSNYLCKAMC